MRVLAVIVAGGRSSRMGRDKAFETVGGRTILARIIAQLSGQVDRVAINANRMEGRFGDSGLALIADIRSDLGTPLAGLHAALSFAAGEGFDAILTVPSDCPFLPDDLARRLSAASHRAAIAASQGQPHYLTGLWSAGLLSQVVTAVDDTPVPRLQDWVSRCAAAIVEWPALPFDPFFNVNTPEELAEAERIAAEFGA